jgi:hypothetical protein
LKRAVCGHWYFFNYGSIADDDIAKHLSNKLANIKTEFNLTSNIIEKIKLWQK